MRDTRKGQLASELARMFTQADLHCRLMIRCLMDDLPMTRENTCLELDDKALLEFEAYIDDLSFIELKASLRALTLSLGQLCLESDCARTNGVKRLETVRRRLEHCRQWLVCLADDDWQQSVRTGFDKEATIRDRRTKQAASSDQTGTWNKELSDLFRN